MDEEKEGWINVMDMEASLLEVDINRGVYSRAFPSHKKDAELSEKIVNKAPWQTEKLILNKDHPFQGLKISSTEPFNGQNERESCPMCSKSRKFFCYTCYVVVPSLQPFTPRVKLPIKIDIVKHRREVEGKSTAVHAPILAPSEVRMFQYPDVPDYTKEKAILVFPGDKSRTLDQILLDVVKQEQDVAEELADVAKEVSDVATVENDNLSFRLSGDGELELGNNAFHSHNYKHRFPYDKIVFIDSTWNQSRGMKNHPHLADLPRMIISSRETIFWRYQRGKPKEYLATIEAIYYFLVDFHQLVLQEEYRGEYDNMLFLFKFMYDKIHQLYDHNSLRAYTCD